MWILPGSSDELAVRAWLEGPPRKAPCRRPPAPSAHPPTPAPHPPPAGHSSHHPAPPMPHRRPFPSCLEPAADGVPHLGPRPHPSLLSWGASCCLQCWAPNAHRLEANPAHGGPRCSLWPNEKSATRLLTSRSFLILCSPWSSWVSLEYLEYWTHSHVPEPLRPVEDARQRPCLPCLGRPQPSAEAQRGRACQDWLCDKYARF